MNHKKTDRMLELAESAGCRSCSSPKAAVAGPATPPPRPGWTFSTMGV
ncbi:hypothetical protein [Streptomyces sp. F001]|nr:hypothetical protein [Streptomyces sp. F001]